MFRLGQQRSANLSDQVESFTGWDELDTNNIYSQASKQRAKKKNFFDPPPTLSQGNWHDLNEFFEYATEWEPSASLYFGDNILQVQSSFCLFLDVLR